MSFIRIVDLERVRRYYIVSSGCQRQIHLCSLLCSGGCDFHRHDEGALCFAPKKHIEKMMDSYFTMFGSKPTCNVQSPLEKGDHPELDTSEFLDEDDTQNCQSLLGAMQWAVSLGRLDANAAAMALSSF